MTFLESIEAFLLELRDDYGFLLPVDRLEQCLVCASDITDVEEVLYRLQSMACGSQEQLEVFRSLFAQRFLGMRPQPPAVAAPKRVNQKDPETVARETQEALDRQADFLQTQVKTRMQQISETRLQLEEAKRALEEHEANTQRYMQENAPLGPDEMSGKQEGASPVLDDPALTAQLKKVITAIKRIEKAALKDNRHSPVNRSKEESTIQSSLQSPYYKTLLEKHTKDLMEVAGKCRSNGELHCFTAILDLMAAISKLSSLAGKTIPASAKKDLKEADKQVRTFQRETLEFEEQRVQLQSRVAQLQNTLKTRERNHRDTEARARDAEQKASAFRIKNTRTFKEPELIIKPAAAVHRDIFRDGVNAVQTTAEKAELLETELQRMSPSDKQRVMTYIRTNARVFRQTLRRKYAAHEKPQVDIRATVRAAGRTGGEPVVIKYRKPKKSHAKVMILTDISGSCRRTATLALYFMALMDEAFPGGCKKFAFVNSLVSVDRFFLDKGPDEGIDALLAAIPTRGVYSDYGTVIHQLRQQYGGSIHRDTTVIFLGDARNNRRETRAEDLKYIADRCRKVFWLDPEDVVKWDTGDSVVGEYAEAGAEPHQVGTVGSLLQFLTDID